MKLYSENEQYKLYQGNMLDMLEVIEPETIDSVICDPPYELNFMGKGWDNSGIAFQPSTWQKCYEVLKPGGYLLAFGGSRTFHRIACAIEDAGFEIRDTIMWLYGSGFPKSLNIGLALDKKNGVDNRTGKIIKRAENSWDKYDHDGGEYKSQYEERIAQNEWQGWGTAMKPSYESIIVAQKPYSIEIYLLIGILDILNEVIDKCQLNLNVNIVEKISKLNQAKQSVEENIVLKNAENKMFTKEDLLEVMDMLQSTLMENMNLNTELLCLNFLVEICNQMNKYTIETKINLITELKILKLLVVENILKNITQENKMKQLGMKQNALTVEEFLKEEKLKLNYMNILSVQDNVILKEERNNLHPSLNQIIVARKPFNGSLVDNIIEYNVGGLNIDECRIGTGTGEKKVVKYPDIRGDNYNQGHHEYNNTVEYEIEDKGRFPANTILTYDESDFYEVCGGFPDTKSSGGKVSMPKMNSKSDGINIYNFGKKNAERLENDYVAPGDSGSASRYFYCAKASKKDRDEGLDDFEAINGGSYNFRQDGSLDGKIPLKRNTHPTVKPTDLMQYLIRLVTPAGGTVLDPFNGSGSTGKAVMYENKERNKNYKYIGIELTEEYLPIAKARIEYVCNLTKEELKEKQLSIFDLGE